MPQNSRCSVVEPLSLICSLVRPFVTLKASLATLVVSPNPVPKNLYEDNVRRREGQVLQEMDTNLAAFAMAYRGACLVRRRDVHFVADVTAVTFSGIDHACLMWQRL